MQYLIIFLLLFSSCRSQTLPEHLKTSYEPLNEKLASLVTVDAYSIPPAEVQNLENPVLLDARELAEYEVSHLPGAIHLGYKKPNYDKLAHIDKDQPIVVYCTIGYRSNKMCATLRERGFSEVYNLYGSIYAWLLAEMPLNKNDGEITNEVHTFNKRWGNYLPDRFEKTY